MAKQKNRKNTSKPQKEIVLALSTPVTSEWSGAPGKKFRRILGVISKFVRKHKLTPADVADEAVTLAKTKVRGASHKDAAAANKDYMQTEQIKLEIALKRRLEETTVTREEAETRLALVKAIDAEFELLKKLTQAGVGLKKDKRGKWRMVPLRHGADLTEAIALELKAEQKQPADSANPDERPSSRQSSSAGA